MNKTSIAGEAEPPTIAAALAAAPRFGLSSVEAKRILKEVYSVASAWRRTGRRLRIRAGTLDAYASAFEQSLMEEAGRLVG